MGLLTCFISAELKQEMDLGNMQPAVVSLVLKPPLMVVWSEGQVEVKIDC